MWDIYNGILLNHKKDEILVFAKIWMDLDSIMLSAISQMEKDKKAYVGYNTERNKPTNKPNSETQAIIWCLPEGTGLEGR